MVAAARHLVGERGLDEGLDLAIEHVAPSTLNAAPYNPRKMSAEARAKLERVAASLKA